MNIMSTLRQQYDNIMNIVTLWQENDNRITISLISFQHITTVMHHYDKSITTVWQYDEYYPTLWQLNDIKITTLWQQFKILCPHYSNSKTTSSIICQHYDNNNKTLRQHYNNIMILMHHGYSHIELHHGYSHIELHRGYSLTYPREWYVTTVFYRTWWCQVRCLGDLP